MNILDYALGRLRSLYNTYSGGRRYAVQMIGIPNGRDDAVNFNELWTLI